MSTGAAQVRPILSDEQTPVYQQLSRQIANQIATGDLPEGSPIPSTTEYSRMLHINPATANRGVSQLVAQGLLVKKRGIGMFVAPGARDAVRSQRRITFLGAHIEPLLSEASLLGIPAAEICELLESSASNRTPDS